MGQCNDLVQLVDLYPTLCDLVELSVPDAQRLQGIGSGDCLLNRKRVGRCSVISENGLQSTVIEQRFNLARWIHPLRPDWDFREAHDLLSDHANDSLEVANLLDDPRFRSHAARLCARLDRHFLTTLDEAWQRTRIASPSAPL